MINDSMMELIMKISADPSQANAAIAEFQSRVETAAARVAASNREVQGTAERVAVAEQAAGQTIAETFRQAGASAQQAKQGYTDLGVSAQAAGARVKEAYAGAVKSGNAWHQTNQGVIQQLRMMRYSAYALTTPLMFTYVIPQLAKVYDQIKNLSLAIGGFDAAAQKAMADTVKASQKAETEFQGLTTAAKIANAQFQIAGTNARILGDEATSAALRATTGLKGLIKAVMGGSAALGTYAAEVKAYSALTSEAVELQNVTLPAQIAALGKLEKQLTEEKKKGTKASYDSAAAVRGEGAAFREAFRAAQGWMSLEDRQKELVARLRAELIPMTRGLRDFSHVESELRQVIDPATQAMLRQLAIERELADTTPRALGMLLPGYNFGPTLTGFKQLTQAQQEALGPTRQETAALRAHELQLRRTAEIGRESFTILGEAVGQYGGTFGRVFSQVSRIIELMINLHRLEAVTAVKAATDKAAGQIAAEEKVSLVKSIVQTAEGIAALARLDFRAAALHFASSAQFLAVLGVAASAIGSLGSFGGGGGGGSGHRASTGSRSSRAASEAEPPVAQGEQAPAINVYVQGDFFETEGTVNKLASIINTQVQGGRVRLIATTTTAIPVPVS